MNSKKILPLHELQGVVFPEFFGEKVPRYQGCNISLSITIIIIACIIIDIPGYLRDLSLHFTMSTLPSWRDVLDDMVLPVVLGAGHVRTMSTEIMFSVRIHVDLIRVNLHPVYHYTTWRAEIINSCHAEFILGNIETHFHFLSFLKLVTETL